MSFPKIKGLVLTLILSVAFSASLSSAQQANQSLQLPGGKWTLSHHPYSRPGYEKMPLLVTGVKGDATQGLAISVAAMASRTSKPIMGYKLNWFLFNEKEPNRVLQTAATPLIYPAQFSANESRQVDIPVVSFIKIYKPLLKDGQLSGDYRIEVAVSEVQFADGTTWKAVGIPAALKQ